jgi:hypothetical protein
MDDFNSGAGFVDPFESEEPLQGPRGGQMYHGGGGMPPPNSRMLSPGERPPQQRPFVDADPRGIMPSASPSSGKQPIPPPAQQNSAPKPSVVKFANDCEIIVTAKAQQ